MIKSTPSRVAGDHAVVSRHAGKRAIFLAMQSGCGNNGDTSFSEGEVPSPKGVVSKEGHGSFSK